MSNLINLEIWSTIDINYLHAYSLMISNKPHPFKSLIIHNRFLHGKEEFEKVIDLITEKLHYYSIRMRVDVKLSIEEIVESVKKLRSMTKFQKNPFFIEICCKCPYNLDDVNLFSAILKDTNYTQQIKIIAMNFIVDYDPCSTGFSWKQVPMIEEVD